MRIPLLVLVLALPFAAPASRAGEEPLRLEIAIDGAVAVKPTERRELVVWVERDERGWDRVWGRADRYNNTTHRGWVAEATTTPERVQLRLRMIVGDDPWVKGGRGEYALDLVRQGDRLSGTWRGTWKGQAVEGTASGSVLPPIPAAPAGFQAMTPDEHPRLPFRAAELPALKAKLQDTPLGRAVFAQLQKNAANPEGDIYANAVLHALTGERRYADACIAPMQKIMSERGCDRWGKCWGPRVRDFAVAWDCCAQAWPAGFRATIEEFLFTWSENLLFRWWFANGQMNPTPGSNYHLGIQSGAAIASLGFWGVKRPLPPRPDVFDAARLWEATPPAGWQAGADAPVWAFSGNTTPQRWIWSGLLPTANAEDLLDAVGGGAYRPAPGATLAYKDAKLVFGPLPQRAQATDGGVAVQRLFPPRGPDDAPAPLGPMTAVLFTVVEVREPRVAQWVCGLAGTRAWLCGRELRDGDYLRLGAGRLPLLVTIAQFSPEGDFDGRFAEIDVEALVAEAEADKAGLLERQRDWDGDKALQDRSGGMDVKLLDVLGCGRREMILSFSNMMGDGGWQWEGEGYTLEDAAMALEYALHWKSLLGTSVTGRPDFTHFVPRYLLATAFRADGSRHMLATSLGHGTHGPEQHYWHLGIALAPEERWKGALAWAACHTAGLGDMAGKALDERAYAAICAQLAGAEYGSGALLTMLKHFPERIVHPNDVMPRAWASPGHGGYIFREGWNGGQEVIAQIYAKDGRGCGWNQADAGNVQLYARGFPWMFKGAFSDAESKSLHKIGHRWFQNVVHFPDDDLDVNAGAKVLRHEADEKTGTGFVVLDMTPIYGTGLRVNKTTGKVAERTRTGITGVRALGCDFSGKAGCPLVVIADRIRGAEGKKRLWIQQVAPQDLPWKEYGANTVKLDAEGFALANGGVTAHATFAAPRPLQIRMNTDKPKLGFPPSPTSVNCIEATVGDDVLVIYRIGGGDLPKIEISGSGPDAVARIGGRTVRFDGERIVFGE